MHAAQSSVGNVLSNCAILPPIVDSRSTTNTSCPAPAISRAACSPAMPPPTTSVAGFTFECIGSRAACSATRLTAARVTALALAVPRGLSRCTQAHCSRMFAIWTR